MEDFLTGPSFMTSAMCDFKECVERIEVLDINSFGLQYMWNQKPKGKWGTLKKLDRVMRNLDFIDMFPGAYAMFQPYRISDHSSAVNGYTMYQVVQKMRNLKKPLRKLLHDQGNLHERVNRLRTKLDEVQIALDKDPHNVTLREEEAVYLTAFHEAKSDEERFLKQKAKVEWLEVGDSNSAYFHKSIKSQNQRSRIDVIRNADDVEVTCSLVPTVFVEHYEAFLGTQMQCSDLDTTGLFTKQVSNVARDNMVRPITNDEIKKAMFNIGDDKAPGPDGYTLVFFKKGWDIVVGDVCNAIRNFFWQCKILTNRIIEGIKDVVSENQSAFVPGRRISDNILIT
ncbi:hypothetical protein Tco_1206233 [Tanacetum coccineum]